jgi:hypothetical protein
MQDSRHMQGQGHLLSPIFPGLQAAATSKHTLTALVVGPTRSWIDMIQDPVAHVDLNRTEAHHTDQTAAGFLARSLAHGNLVFAFIGCVWTQGATILSFHLVSLERITRKAKETHLEVVKVIKAITWHRQQTNRLLNLERCGSHHTSTAASTSLFRETKDHEELAGADLAKQTALLARNLDSRGPPSIPKRFTHIGGCDDVSSHASTIHPSMHSRSYTFTMNKQVLFHERHHT